MSCSEQLNAHVSKDPRDIRDDSKGGGGTIGFQRFEELAATYRSALGAVSSP